jgi:hypothetical protein
MITQTRKEMLKEMRDEKLFNTLEDAFNIGWSLSGVHLVCAHCSGGMHGPVFEFGPDVGVLVVKASDAVPAMRAHARREHESWRFLDGRG